MSKEINVCQSFLSFGRQAARTFSWHLCLVPKKPTLHGCLFFVFGFGFFFFFGFVLLGFFFKKKLPIFLRYTCK